MKIQLSFLIPIIFAANCYCQGRTYNFDQFNVKIENSKLEVFDKYQKLVFEKKFIDPHDLSADLDGDGINEYLVIDEMKDSSRSLYTLYIFNTIDSFYVADSIPSGYLEPYQSVSEDSGSNIIVTGNPNFDSLNIGNEDTFIPIKCWKYDNGEIFSVNDEVYNIFISENDKLIDMIDSYFDSNTKDCKSTETVKAAIATVYANYIYAGDKILANQFLKKYYLCSDLEKFKRKLDELL